MKKIALLATTAALVMSLGAFTACSPSTNSDSASSENVVEQDAAEAESNAVEAEDATTPAVGSAADGVGTTLPADHAGRLETMDAAACSMCHGAQDETGTPAAADAKANPEDHYVDNSYATGEINDTHQNCSACHAESDAS